MVPRWLPLCGIVVLSFTAPGGPASGETGPSASRTGSTGSPLSQREIFLEARNPLDHFESNTRLWYSLNQVFARGTDLLGIELGFDEHILGRAFSLALAVYLSGGVAYYSHEFGHTREDRKNGARKGFGLDWGEWVQLGYPAYLKPPAPWNRWSPEESFRDIVNGVNQTSCNAYFAWKRSVLTGSTDFYSGLIFLEAQFDHLWQLYFAYQERGSGTDADRYLWDLGRRNIDLGRDQYLGQALLASLLSWHAWESAFAIGKFVVTGKRSTPGFRARVARAATVTPPLASLFLTSRGSYCVLRSFVFVTGHPVLELSLGRRVDVPGASRVKGLRLGVTVRSFAWGLSRRLRVSLAPTFVLNFRRSRGAGQPLLGFEGSAEMYGVALTFRLEYSRDDVFRNRVQAERPGLRAVLGLEIRI